VSFLLDTDTVSFAIRGERRVVARLLSIAPSEVAISVVTEAELWFGVEKLGSPKLRHAVEAFLGPVTVEPVTRDVAREYGAIRVWLERHGRPIGLADTFIAAHARSLGRVLVTSNVRHFSRVPRLRVEDWRTTVP